MVPADSSQRGPSVWTVDRWQEQNLLGDKLNFYLFHFLASPRTYNLLKSTLHMCVFVPPAVMCGLDWTGLAAPQSASSSTSLPHFLSSLSAAASGLTPAPPLCTCTHTIPPNLAHLPIILVMYSIVGVIGEC